MSNEAIRTDIRMNDVFISWTGKDRELKDRIVQYLKNHSIEVLESDSECTGNFSVWSREAVSKCTVFLLLYTKNTLNSEYVPQEIEAFKKLDAWDDRIIPVVSSQKLYSEKLPDLLSAKVSAVEFTKESKNPTYKDANATNDYNLDDLTDSILEEILKKVQKQITNRLFKIYREATKPAYLKLKSFLKMVNAQDREFNYEQLYINRSVLDENGNSIDDASVFTSADDIFFLQGPAGSGKSCYIDQLRKSANENTVVISVPCRKLLNNVTLFQAMFEEFSRNCGHRDFYTEADFKSLLNARHLLLVLDGMDEIATKNGTRKMVDAVSDYYNAHASETTLFFTSRNKDDANSIAMNGQEPKRLTLCALEESQIATFGENLFMLLEKPDKSEAFYVRIKDLADEIRKNPLLISQLAIIYDKNNDIPQTVVGIYDAICEITFSRDNNVSDVPAEYSEMITHRLPRILKAFSAERYRRASIGKMTDSREGVVMILASILRGMTGMCDDARERAEFLEEYLRDRAIIVDNDFYHKILLEYFTAVCFYEQSFNDYDEIKDETALKELFAHYSDPYWSDVIKLFLVKADSSIDSEETASLYNLLSSYGMTEYTLLFDACRDLLRHKEEAQRTLLCDILKKSADETYPPYGPMFWYVPEYEIYAPLLMALESLTEEECFTKALALVRDVCWIFGHYNTAKEITEDVDASALLSRANLKGVRLGLCELFYSGSTNETKGDNIYPRCFNLAEAKSWKENGQGVLNRMTEAFEDELGLYSHEMFSELNGEYIGIVAAPYDKERLESVLPQKSHKKLCGLFFSPTEEKDFESLKINDKHLKSVYAPENILFNRYWHTSYYRCGSRYICILNDSIIYFFSSLNIPGDVIVVREYAFSNCESLKKIIISKGVTYIGSYAFSNCTSLEEIFVPDSVTTIGCSAFESCTSLEEINIPDNMATIEDRAFEGCTTLKKITLPNRLNKIEKNIFNRCTSLKKMTIPNNVTTIEDCAFRGCTSLENIILSNRITSIGWGVFEGCASLKEITIPNNVKHIGSCAFSNCASLSKFCMLGSVTKIETCTFEGCESLEEINISNGITHIGPCAFLNCSALEKIFIPDSVTTIGDNAFKDCAALKLIDNCPEGYSCDFLGAPEECEIRVRQSNCNSETLVIAQGTEIIKRNEFVGRRDISKIDMPDSVKEIGPNAFEGCSSLKEITMPKNVTSLGSGAFKGCTSLKEITIPKNVTSLGNCTFEGCESLRKVTISGNVTSIGGGVFEGCSSLEEINIPNSVTEIDVGALSRCTSLKKLFIPDSVTTIGCNAFENCTSLEEINIPDRVTTIGCNAFENCTSLEEINIPDRVTTIGWSAFEGCESLRKVTIPDNVKLIGGYTFGGCSALEEIFLPDNVTIIEENAFSGCTSLVKINIPNRVTVIEVCAFKECTALKKISIPSNVKEIKVCAFEGCESLEEINISNGITHIGPCAFLNCSALEKIFIPDSVTTIGDNAFKDCAALKLIDNCPEGYSCDFLGAPEECEIRVRQSNCNRETLVIAQGTEIIKRNEFVGRRDISKIDMPDSIKEIGPNAFEGCTSLKEITIPKNVTSLGNCTFEGCESLRKVTISGNVTSIGWQAFEGCTSLKKVNILYNTTNAESDYFEGSALCKESPQLDEAMEIKQTDTEDYTAFPEIMNLFNRAEIGYSAFGNCTSLTEITIPFEVTVISEFAFCNCISLENISIPAKVLEISDNAFYGCVGLKEITISYRFEEDLSRIFSGVDLSKVKINWI